MLIELLDFILEVFILFIGVPLLVIGIIIFILFLIPLMILSGIIIGMVRILKSIKIIS